MCEVLNDLFIIFKKCISPVHNLHLFVPSQCSSESKEDNRILLLMKEHFTQWSNTGVLVFTQCVYCFKMNSFRYKRDEDDSTIIPCLHCSEMTCFVFIATTTKAVVFFWGVRWSTAYALLVHLVSPIKKNVNNLMQFVTRYKSFLQHFTEHLQRTLT